MPPSRAPKIAPVVKTIKKSRSSKKTEKKVFRVKAIRIIENGKEVGKKAVAIGLVMGACRELSTFAKKGFTYTVKESDGLRPWMVGKKFVSPCPENTANMLVLLNEHATLDAEAQRIIYMFSSGGGMRNKKFAFEPPFCEDEDDFEKKYGDFVAGGKGQLLLTLDPQAVKDYFGFDRTTKDDGQLFERMLEQVWEAKYLQDSKATRIFLQTDDAYLFELVSGCNVKSAKIHEKYYRGACVKRGTGEDTQLFQGSNMVGNVAMRVRTWLLARPEFAGKSVDEICEYIKTHGEAEHKRYEDDFFCSWIAEQAKIHDPQIAALHEAALAKAKAEKPKKRSGKRASKDELAARKASMKLADDLKGALQYIDLGETREQISKRSFREEAVDFAFAFRNVQRKPGTPLLSVLRRRLGKTNKTDQEALRMVRSKTECAVLYGDDSAAKAPSDAEVSAEESEAAVVAKSARQTPSTAARAPRRALATNPLNKKAAAKAAPIVQETSSRIHSPSNGAAAVPEPVRPVKAVGDDASKAVRHVAFAVQPDVVDLGSSDDERLPVAKSVKRRRINRLVSEAEPVSGPISSSKSDSESDQDTGAAVSAAGSESDQDTGAAVSAAGSESDQGSVAGSESDQGSESGSESDQGSDSGSEAASDSDA
jgi:hypothetical protein